MFNETYVKEYIDIIQGDPKKYYEDYVKMVDAVNHSNAIYKGQPIPVTYQGMFYGKEHKESFEKISETLMNIGRKVTEKFLKDESYRKLFPFGEELNQLILHDPGYDVPVPVCRYDIFYNSPESFKMCEFNTDGASAMNEENTIGAILLDTLGMKEFAKGRKLQNLELFDSWVKASLEVYRLARGADAKPNVAIVDLIDKGTTYEFEEFKKAYERAGLRCEIVDPRDIVYCEGKIKKGDYEIDLVYRRIVTVDLMEAKESLRPFLQGYLDGAFVMVGSLRSQIMHSKLLFKILRLPETKEVLTPEESRFIDEHIPFTEELETPEDYELVLNRKDEYILKPFDSYASHGVYAGRDHSPEEWKKILDQCLGKGFIYQEYFDMDKIDFVEFDEEGNLSVRGFSAVIGMFIYNEKFSGLYTRIGNQALISGARDYYTTPNILVD